eukprot:TRINITY_DN701_c0_g1_i1.p2 TRINITY_DN701_c0_g1~~TRINITY_DN701_c0_g1_i1.p2  ORF type:complete len:181 (-),score=64.37 TRINITY_DN701_c0_g1_i1:134-676(-)
MHGGSLDARPLRVVVADQHKEEQAFNPKPPAPKSAEAPRGGAAGAASRGAPRAVKEKKASKFDIGVLAKFLADLELTEFTPVFQKEQIDVRALKLLNDDDLKSIGVPVGPRRIIQSSLKDYDFSAPAAVVKDAAPADPVTDAPAADAAAAAPEAAAAAAADPAAESSPVAEESKEEGATE